MSRGELNSNERATDDLSPGRHERGRRDGSSSQRRHSSTASKSTSSFGSDSESNTSATSMPKRPTSRYRKAFKRFVVGLSREPKPEKFEASFIGGSLWSPHEKAVLFRQLDICSRHDPGTIAEAIETKSAIEVREYLTALQEASDDVFAGRFECDAALDIGTECEEAMEREAVNLERKTFKTMCQLEQETYGEDWLIDTIKGDAIEEAFAKGIDSGQELPLDIPGAELLSPAALLEVSRNVFMNSGSDPAACYNALEVQHNGADGPAMFCSAFEVLHHICVEYTKRLVAAAHFQALSRIRARKDPRIQQAVRLIDVDTALSIMGVIKADPRGYWAKKVEQYRLDVYSESRGYADGRTHKRNHGYSLTPDEVARELEKGSQSLEGVVFDTEHDLDDQSPAAVSQTSTDDWENDDVEDEDPGQSEVSEDADTDDEIEEQDQMDSRMEEDALRELLKMPPLPSVLEQVVSGGSDAPSRRTATSSSSSGHGTSRKRKRTLS